MDVITFKFKKLDYDKQRQIRRLANTNFNDNGGAARIRRWFEHEAAGVTVEFVRNSKFPEYVDDYKITMSKENYVEFCLKWM